MSFTLRTKRVRPSCSLLCRVLAGMTIFQPPFHTLRPTRRELENSAGTALPQIIAAPQGQALARPLEQAFSDATRLTGFAAALFILVGLLSSLLLPKPTSEKPIA